MPVNTTRLCRTKKIVSSMYFSDAEGNKVEPAHYGIEHEAIDGARDVTMFEDLETAGRDLPSLEMKRWRTLRIAVKLRAGIRYSINSPQWLRGWDRRSKEV